MSCLLFAVCVALYDFAQRKWSGCQISDVIRKSHTQRQCDSNCVLSHLISTLIHSCNKFCRVFLVAIAFRFYDSLGNNQSNKIVLWIAKMRFLCSCWITTLNYLHANRWKEDKNSCQVNRVADMTANVMKILLLTYYSWIWQRTYGDTAILTRSPTALAIKLRERESERPDIHTQKIPSGKKHPGAVRRISFSLVNVPSSTVIESMYFT